MFGLVDKVMLRFARDTLQLYHALTGKGKFRLALTLMYISGTIQIVTILACTYLFTVKYGVLHPLTILYVIFSFFFPLLIAVSLRQDIILFKLIEREEERAKENGALASPDTYQVYYRAGRYWIIMSPIIILIPPPAMIDFFWVGAIIYALANYIVCVDNLPPGKTIFEKIKNKIQSLAQAPAMPEPVKISIQ